MNSKQSCPSHTANAYHRPIRLNLTAVMTSPSAPTLWIVGTSVSIEDGGYATLLAERAAQLGISTRNLSVGDQTSIMGCMRVLDQGDDIKAGNVVVWEYSLLDTLLRRPPFFARDVHAARRVAWQSLLDRGASVIVLLTAPKKHLATRTACEARIARDARALRLPCIDTRELFAGMGIHNPAAHYRDDRHPRGDSPVIGAMVDAVLECALAPAPPDKETVTAWARKNITAHWQWEDAQSLAMSARLTLRTIHNSLVAIDALPLAEGMAIAIPAASRIVGIGIVSTHESGGIWCGHPGCPPASTRLPAKLPYGFLLRNTAVPCLRGRVSSIASATDHTYGSGVWADYGQELSNSPGEVAVFGILYETQSVASTQFMALAHRCWRRLRMLLHRLSGR
jgi:hypothetical protein